MDFQIFLQSLVLVLIFLAFTGAHRVPHNVQIEAPSGSIWEELQTKLPASCEISLEGGPLRSDFPSDFVFGFATAAYQIEGAASIDGRGPSIWDYFSHLPGKIFDNSTGDVADDSYHHWKKDIELMKATGIKAYRFSISWSRILPEGVGRINPLGVKWYSDFIDALLDAGITPAITLYHWDLPMALLQKYGGWLSLNIVKDFTEYADLCFSLWGHKVKLWFSLNEPDWCANGGFSRGVVAPGRCSNRTLCAEGDTAREPYIVLHNFLVAHGSVAKLYREKYQGLKGGQIGIIIDPWYFYPLTDSDSDREAAETLQIFATSLFFDPVYFGDYPAVTKEHIGERLVPFTPEEFALVKGSVDFYGINFYTGGFATWETIPPVPPTPEEQSWDTDGWALATRVSADGVPIGRETASDWLYEVPEGMKMILLWITKRYNGIPIYVTENGMSDKNDPNIPLDKALCDEQRVGFYQSYLANLAEAIKLGANVQGYFAWSLLDNFEWGRGYSERYGIHFVNYTDPALPRYPKASAYWWTGFLQTKDGNERRLKLE